ncbi:MAG: hypothetical protein II961_05145 [Candidatus Riflebacteria bacterium]|nr:hypothetical protein [Candidatus Riflebacteria bacterium]
MRKLFFAALFGIMLSSGEIMADNVKQPLNENGLYIKGVCKAIASSPDGYVYVLTRDKRLIRIDYDGDQKEIAIPFNKEIKSEDDYFCDMAVDTKTAYFCGYNYSSILALDVNNPKELKAMNLSYENKPINPMIISRNIDGWCLKDFDFRTFKVDKKGQMTLLPDSTEVVLDKKCQSVIVEQPVFTEEGKTIFPKKVFKEDKSVRWVAPEAEAPKQVTSIEYLGFDIDRSLDVYLVKAASGELDTEVTIYAVNNTNNSIVSKKVIPNSSLNFIMRYCKLTTDGSIIAVYADPQNPDEQFILKKFELKGIEPPNKG